MRGPEIPFLQVLLIFCNDIHQMPPVHTFLRANQNIKGNLSETEWPYEEFLVHLLQTVLEANIIDHQGNNIQEVNNSPKALTTGCERLRHLPLSTRLLLELHGIILWDARFGYRSTGAYRRVQNFVGPTTDIKDATYIPPEPQRIDEYMSNLGKYMNDELPDEFDPLIRAGIVHAQFETIHPFLDGNGRLGGILIVLYFLDKGVLSRPSFFIGEELEKNKHRYCGLLNNLRTSSPAWKEWLAFFLGAAERQADKNIDKLRQTEDLLNWMLRSARENKIREDLIRFIFRKPIFTIKEAAAALGVGYNTASMHVHRLAKANRVSTGTVIKH